MAWELGVTKENIVSGFRACGIYPLNRHAARVSAFLPSQPFDKPIHTPTATNTSDISTSVTDGQIETTVEIEPVHTALASSTLTTATELNDTSENIILEKSVVDDSNCTSNPEVVSAASSILNGFLMHLLIAMLILLNLLYSLDFFLKTSLVYQMPKCFQCWILISVHSIPLCRKTQRFYLIL